MITLSEREIRIIELKSQGKTVKEIAPLLFVSKRYAEKMINALYHKTGCKTSGGLVSWGYKMGILQINAENIPTG